MSFIVIYLEDGNFYKKKLKTSQELDNFLNKEAVNKALSYLTIIKGVELKYQVKKTYDVDYHNNPNSQSMAKKSITQTVLNDSLINDSDDLDDGEDVLDLRHLGESESTDDTVKPTIPIRNSGNSKSVRIKKRKT